MLMKPISHQVRVQLFPSKDKAVTTSRCRTGRTCRVQTHAPDHAAIERAQAMPKQGASSGFKYGRATGALEAVIACCEVPVTIIEPTAWKKAHHLHGQDKEGARQLALQLFPSAHASFARRMDHGRAEAALIALFAANNRGAL